MEKVIITVTSIKVGMAKITSYPYRPKRLKYSVPLYKVTVRSKEGSSSNIISDFKAIRFGVKRTRTIEAHMVGLQDAQSYILRWDYITTMYGLACICRLFCA